MAKKMRRPGACDWNVPQWMGEHMRCPNGHRKVRLSAGRERGKTYLEATCHEEGCGLVQRITDKDLPDPVL